MTTNRPLNESVSIHAPTAFLLCVEHTAQAYASLGKCFLFSEKRTLFPTRGCPIEMILFRVFLAILDDFYANFSLFP